MSWDQKGKYGPYYYRTLREGRTVRKLYLGKGKQAEAAARDVEQRRQARQAAREAWHQEQARLAGAEQQLHDLRALAQVLVRAFLDGAGYHEHRGEYRRRRHARDGDNPQASD